MSDRAARSRSFESVAAEYERHRPEYPEEAVRWAAEQLGLAPGARVLDVGAGTGKLTRGLVALGFERRGGRAGSPDARRSSGWPCRRRRRSKGRRRRSRFRTRACDAAFAGQAFHWFDRERALPELHRVISAGGGLVLLWNWWDERDPLQRELGELIGYAGHEPYRDEELPGEPWFREVGRTVVESARGVEPGGTRRLSLDGERVPHGGAGRAGRVAARRPRTRLALRRAVPAAAR